MEADMTARARFEICTDAKCGHLPPHGRIFQANGELFPVPVFSWWAATMGIATGIAMGGISHADIIPLANEIAASGLPGNVTEMDSMAATAEHLGEFCRRGQ